MSGTPRRKGGLEEWPADRPLPRFASHEEEDRFWSSHEFEADADPAAWEAVDGPAVLWTPTGTADVPVRVARRRGAAALRRSGKAG